MLYENLRKWYRKLKNTRSIVEETIWCMFPTYPCIGYLSAFHDLSQHGNHISTLKVLSSVQELFEETNGSLHLQRVLIEGDTGIGKTTLCKEICYQWAENNLFTPDELVLLLLLQDPCAQKITSEHELAEYFTTSFDFIESFSEYLISSCGARVTIVIDSYDKLNEELLKEGFIKDLIEGKRLPKARIIITSTLFVSYHLHDCVGRRVELFELAKSTKNKFIAAALKNFPVKCEMLQKHFLEYPKVDMLSCIPINMAIIVSLCHKNNLSPYDLPCDIDMYATFSVCDEDNLSPDDLSPDDLSPDDLSSDDLSSDDLSSDDLSSDDLSPDDLSSDDLSPDDLSSDDLSPDDLPCDIVGMYETFSKCVMEMNYSFVYHIQKERPITRFQHAHMGTKFKLKKCAREKLNYFAIVALIKNNLVFLETELFDMCKKYPTCYGFMQSIECYTSVHHGKRVLYNFLCQGLHLYLAASYVSKCKEDAIINILKNCLPTNTRRSLFYAMPIEWSMQVLNMCILALKMRDYFSKDLIKEITKYLHEEISITSDITDYPDKTIKSYNIHSCKSNIFAKQTNLPKDLLTTAPFLVTINVPTEQDRLMNFIKSRYSDSGYVSHGISPKYCDLFATILYSPYQIFNLFQLFQKYLLNHFERLMQISQRGHIIYFTKCILLPYHIVALGLLLLHTEKKVCKLHLPGCCIGDYGLYLLQRYLCVDKKHELNVINFCDNNLTSASSTLINILIDHFKPHSLGLDYNKLRDAGVAKLHNAVIRNNIQQLDLVENGLTMQASKSIALMMKSLKRLDISFNNIGDDGAKMISQGILQTSTLSSLNLNHCNIGAVGTGEIAHSLTINSSLEILWMNDNAIGHYGATGIAAALCVNKTLKELSLTGDSTIDYGAASEILAGASRNNSLTFVHITNSSIINV